MGLLDRILGRSRDDGSIPGMTGGGVPRGYSSPTAQYQQPTAAPAPAAPGAGRTDHPARTQDEVAIDRYRYLLRTAPPDAVEQAHTEAFSQLTPEQRRQVLSEVGATLPASERATSDDPQALARMATRAEMRNPGTLEQTFRGGSSDGAVRGGPGFGSMVGSSLLGTVAGVVIGSAVANAMFGPAFGDPGTPVAEDAAAGDAGAGGGEPAGAGEDGSGGEGLDQAGADAGGDEGLFGGFFGGEGGGLGDFFGGDGGGGFDI